jgi:hypothetical protein
MRLAGGWEMRKAYKISVETPSKKETTSDICAYMGE